MTQAMLQASELIRTLLLARCGKSFKNGGDKQISSSRSFQTFLTTSSLMKGSSETESSHTVMCHLVDSNKYYGDCVQDLKTQSWQLLVLEADRLTV